MTIFDFQILGVCFHPHNYSCRRHFNHTYISTRNQSLSDFHKLANQKVSNIILRTSSDLPGLKPNIEEKTTVKIEELGSLFFRFCQSFIHSFIQKCEFVMFLSKKDGDSLFTLAVYLICTEYF